MVQSSSTFLLSLCSFYASVLKSIVGANMCQFLSSDWLMHNSTYWKRPTNLESPHTHPGVAVFFISNVVAFSWTQRVFEKRKPLVFHGCDPIWWLPPSLESPPNHLCDTSDRVSCYSGPFRSYSHVANLLPHNRTTSLQKRDSCHSVEGTISDHLETFLR